MSDSWCRDIQRDEAVRAVEDGRQGPLPTLEEAIAAITQKGNDMATKAEIQAADYRAEATSERTERVTERRPPEPGGGGNVTGLRTQRVSLSLRRMGELVEERDAAIREREKLRGEITSVLDRSEFAAKELTRLRTRVTELEAASGAAVLAEIAAAFGCQPDDDADLVEAARLLVRERDDAVAKAASGAAGKHATFFEADMPLNFLYAVESFFPPNVDGYLRQCVTVKEVGRE